MTHEESQPYNYFGDCVSLSADGNILAVGAPRHDALDSSGNPMSAAGHVRVFQRDATHELGWFQLGQDIDGETYNYELGESVSLSANGNILAVGAPGFGTQTGGKVKVFQKPALANGSWTQIGSDINAEATGDEFGVSVSLSSDGSIIAIGADENDGNGNRSGHVRIYQNNSGNWTQVGGDIDGAGADNWSGRSVSLSSDGSIVAIGARGHLAYLGLVRVYQRNTSASLGWSQIGTDIVGVESGGQLGYSVSLSSDGSILAVGVPYEDNPDSWGSNSGATKIFKNINGSWTQIGQTIYAVNPGAYRGNMVSLSSDGSVVVAGAYGSSYVQVHEADVDGYIFTMPAENVSITATYSP